MQTWNGRGRIDTENWQELEKREIRRVQSKKNQRVFTS
jgi:hypothetical protein